MPNISAAGTYTKASAGCVKLQATNAQRTLLFAGTSLGASCTVQYTDDAGVDRDIPNGSITVLPTALMVTAADVDLKIVVTGSPSFNVTISAVYS